MNDPYIPTGRELDEGITVDPPRRQSPTRKPLWRRLLRAGDTPAPRPLLDHEIEVPDDVGQKPIGLKSRESLQFDGADAHAGDSWYEVAKTQETLFVDSTAGSQLVLPVTHSGHSSATVDGNDSPGKVQRHLGPSPSEMSAVFLVCRKPVAQVRELWAWARQQGLANPCLEAGDWWTSGAEVGWSVIPDSLAAVAPDEVKVIIEWVSTVEPGDDPLSSYQAQCSMFDTCDDSVKALARAARGYPSLTPLIECLESRDLARAQRHLDFESAAWNACKAEIASALSAVEKVSASEEPLMAKLPRALADASEIQVAVLASFCRPTSVSRRVDGALELLAQMEGPWASSELLDWARGLAKAGRR